MAPAQTAAAFLARRLDERPLPACSYRLGVRAGRCDQLYPAAVTEALATALARFDRRMPGYASEHALLIGIESRTSAPLRIERGPGRVCSAAALPAPPLLTACRLACRLACRQACIQGKPAGTR